MYTAFTSGSPLRETQAKQPLSAGRFKEIKGSLGESEREGGGREGRDEERRREQGKGRGKEREGEGRDRKRAEAKANFSLLRRNTVTANPHASRQLGGKIHSPSTISSHPESPTRAFYG